MNMKLQQYRLSNRQQKELVIRGQELTIALPAPPILPASLEEFVRQSLPELPADIDVTASTALLPVALPPVGDGDGTADHLGRIVADVVPADTIVVQMSVVIAMLTPPRCRGALPKTQWPGVILE